MVVGGGILMSWHRQEMSPSFAARVSPADWSVETWRRAWQANTGITVPTLQQRPSDTDLAKLALQNLPCNTDLATLTL